MPAIATDTSSTAHPATTAGQRLGSPRRSSRQRTAVFRPSDRRLGRLDRRVPAVCRTSYRRLGTARGGVV